MSAQRKTFFFLLFLHLFLVLVFSGLSYEHLHVPGSLSSSSAKSIKMATNNLISPPISNIQISETCSFAEKTIVLYEFKGTRIGCICEDRSYNERETRKSRTDCGWITNKPGVRCEFVGSRGKEMWSVWEGRKICVKNYEDGQYSYVVGSAFCPSGQRLCAKSLCVRSDLLCPITSLTPGSNSDPEKILIGVSIFKINRITEESPLVDLQVSINGFQCLNTDIFPKTSLFPAVDVVADGCQELGDSSAWSKLLKTEDQLTFYRENNKQIADLPFFSNFLNPIQKAGLYSFSRILVKNENVCSQYNNEMKSLLNESEDVMNNLYTITTFLFVFVPVSFFGLIFGNKESRCMTATIIVSFIGTVILSFVFGSMYFSGITDKFSNGASKEEAFSQIINANCYQNYPGINTAFKNLLNGEDSGQGIVAPMALGLIIWNVLFILLIAAAILWIFRNSESPKHALRNIWLNQEY